MRPRKFQALCCALALLTASHACAGELRIWHAATGGFTTEAEFVSLVDGKLVRLRLKDGTQRDVPLDKLTLDDQALARKLATASTSAAPTDERLAKLERETTRSRSAEDALRLYRIYREDPATTDDQRKVTDARFTELQGLAAKKMMRVNGKWASADEYAKKRKDADALMKQGLELLRLKQGDTFRQKFAEASALEPDDIRADFWVGML